ncbi:MAG: hypothetical protein QOH37_3625 [Nocardioidaceae bacterium]|nr:hypothetical protein [Nocardioidaceae bacterium]
MTWRVARAAAVFALLTTMLGCADEQVVRGDGGLPTPSPTPSRSVPTQAALARYVSPSGDDHNLGTVDKPWRTLTHALGRVYAGQVLFVRGGTYREQIDHVRLHYGTPTAPITVLAYPGENPVLVGSLSLRRPTYWLIDNLDVRGNRTAQQAPFMVKVVGGLAWTWENSEFEGTVGRANVMITGFGIGEPSGFRFSGNCLHGLPGPPMGSTNLFLGSMLTGAGGVIDRNVIFNTDGQPNMRIGSGAGAPSHVRIRQNTIYGGSLGIEVRGHPHHIKIIRNILGGSSAPAMIRFHRGLPRGTAVASNVAVQGTQLLRPEVRKIVQTKVHGFGNVALPQDPEFVDTARCDGFRPRLDALIPYGALAP